MSYSRSIFQHLALDFVSVTEQAAIAASKWIGKGDGKAADKDAVDAMRQMMNTIDFRGEVVIGEGAKDEAAELYIGEKLGKENSKGNSKKNSKSNGPLLDIAVDPLECTNSVAFGRSNSITVIALAPKGNLYKAADSYMEKIAVGSQAKNVIDLDAPVAINIRKVAKALGKKVGEITVAVLDRERNQKLIQEIRKAGARIQLFTDGDVSWAYATCVRESPVDLMMGIGGSTEAVLAATALKCLGGQLLCRWRPKDEKHIARLRHAGITNFQKIFGVNDLARGDDLAFIATGVLSGPLASGVNLVGNHIHTETLVISSKPKTFRRIITKHKL
ncbi:MAG: class II fructose-bisphosphatase [bacterium]|nr:class II fructose-bisphosphatase [bacterium]